MELSSIDPEYASFMNEAEMPQRDGSAFGKLLKTHKRKILVLSALSTICLFAFTIGFFWAHSSSSTDGGMLYSRSLEDEDIDGSVPIWKWSEEDFQERFDRFVDKHGKVYADEGERNKRYAIFKDNLHYIHAQNSIEGRGYKLGITQFADMTREEFQKKYLGCMTEDPKLLNSTVQVDTSLQKDESDLPKSVDWRKRNCVTEVFDQGDCGSCYAFSASAAISAAWCAKTGQLIHLSEQELVDCSTGYGNNGCNGGMMDDAFEFAKIKGLCPDILYPYNAKENQCKKLPAAVKVKAHFRAYQSVDAVKTILATKSPVSIGIHMGDEGMANIMHYKSGIFQGDCGRVGLMGHAMLIVGYGTNEQGEEYWIVKNSWGRYWGEEGYIRMTTAVSPHNRYGVCEMLSVPSYPVV